MIMANWVKIEDDFRAAAFHTYYNTVYGSVNHPVERFALALIASSRPIRNRRGREAIEEWHRIEHGPLRGKRRAEALAVLAEGLGFRPYAFEEGGRDGDQDDLA